MTITDFTKHDKRGFDIPESMPLAEYSKHFPLPLEIVRVSWRDSHLDRHEIDAKDIFVAILPDREGLMCLETPRSVGGSYRGYTGAFVLNENASLRYKLGVPIELTNRDLLPDVVRYFSWIEYSKNYGRYGLVAVIAGAGTYYFELDYHTGQFLWGREIKD